MAVGSRHLSTEQASAVDLRTNDRSPTIWLGDKGDWSVLIVRSFNVLSFARSITFLITVVEYLAAPIENLQRMLAPTHLNADQVDSKAHTAPLPVWLRHTMSRNI
jgi:hypothetical protein